MTTTTIYAILDRNDMKGYTSRRYEGIPVGLEIRRDIGKDKIFRVRRGNGFYGSVAGERIQDQYSYFVPGSINNSEGSYARDFLREAVAGWQGLSEATKNEWRAKAKKRRGMTGYALFISNYIKENYAVATFIEDADKDTRVDTEATPDEDRVRIKTGNVIRAVIGPAGCETVYGFFHDRGDPGSNDFALGNFTTDGTWRDLDLSAIVPAGAKAVLLKVQINDDVINSYFELRENGNSNGYNVSVYETLIANSYRSEGAIVGCDSNRVIEYKASNVVWSAIYMTVRGWWK